MRRKLVNETSRTIRKNSSGDYQDGYKVILAKRIWWNLNPGYRQADWNHPAGAIHHFSDKEVLYLDVMNKLSGKIRQEINKVMRKHDLASEEQLLEIVKVLKKHHPLSIYDQYRQAMLLLSKSSQQKLNIIFTMDYLEPISDYFKQPSVKLRPDLLPKEAAELFLASLSPLFGTYQLIGGHSISDDERDQLILDCIINGLAKREK